MIDFPSELELAARLLVAAVLGAAVGFEREMQDHPAGLRTHLSVALGSALFAIVSAYAFREFAGADGVYQVDVTRVASNIVTGVGFLGGGTILKHGVSVRGLTTAASLWVTAAIGLAVGLGEFVTAVVTSLVLLASLLGLRPFVRFLGQRLAREQMMVIVAVRDDVAPMVVVRRLKETGADLRSVNIDRSRGRVSIEADVRGAPGKTPEVMATELLGYDEIESVEVV